MTTAEIRAKYTKNGEINLIDFILFHSIDEAQEDFRSMLTELSKAQAVVERVRQAMFSADHCAIYSICRRCLEPVDGKEG